MTLGYFQQLATLLLVRQFFCMKRKIISMWNQIGITKEYIEGSEWKQWKQSTVTRQLKGI